MPSYARYLVKSRHGHGQWIGRPTALHIGIEAFNELL
jgi:hypothetical protein